MAGGDQNDPFFWDEDRVVLEMCTSNRSWKAPPAKRLPDPAALEARLRDCGVDGESLLTYGDEFDFDKLWAYLGVKKLPHQLSIKEAITQFRRRSLGYRQWKAQQLADNQLCSEENGGMAVEFEPHKPAVIERVAQAAPVFEAVDGGPDTESRAALPELANSCQGVLSHALSPSVDRALLAPLEVPEALASEQELVEEPPSKKRRIAPTTVSTKPTGNSAFAIIPTEGDVLLRGTVRTVLHAGNSSGFLGADILLRDQLTNPQTLDPRDSQETTFAWVRKQLPPGRRIQVSASMKRFLRLGRVDRLDHSTGLEEDPLDPLLPAFGESDAESVDSVTWREVQKEEQERAATELRKNAAKDRSLTKDEVADAVRNAIQELELQWMAEKKPKLDFKAWRTWQEARSNPDHLALISSAKSKLEHYNGRITLLSRQIIKQPWTVGDDIQRKLSYYLEGSVFERKHQAWRIDVLENPRQPPKPTMLPRLTPKQVKPSKVDDESDTLTSDSDDMDAFIEFDDEVAPFANDEMEVDPEPPFRQTTTARVDDEMEIDAELPSSHNTTSASPERDDPVTHGDEADTSFPLTRATSSNERADNGLLPTQATPKKIKAERPTVLATPCRSGTSAAEAIEVGLTPSPCKLLDGVQVPGMNDLESLEKIGEIGVDYWEKLKDAKRLVVAVLCKWPRERTVQIYDAIKSRDHRVLWAEYIWPTLKAPDSVAFDSTAFIFCRLFDVFVSKSAVRVDLHSLRPMTCLRMEREGNSFQAFCAHLMRIIPVFLGVVLQSPAQTVPEPRTESSGTPRTPDFRDPAEDPSTPEGSSSDDQQKSSTKKRRRRKRHDKIAADIRVSNLKVNEEHERRRRQLREKMAQLGSVSSKLSRLIVNETKESDDQALIYINDHIGTKIKDHQIEGVRFMWNQVVVDSSIRQGCLLAHTMGLGKTMQVITLLVVIAESSASPDKSVRSQIPENLRDSKTLVLCPPTLVDNWYEEIQMWAPDGILGPVVRLYGTLSPSRRMESIQAWASSGGVLIIGYTMFTNLVRGDDEVAKLLLETPSLVIGDEAHYMKNPDSQRHQATANFKTMNRIAMTGSPLTNNVMDYYAMINWVAPNYLADIAEFRQRFSNPIRDGLYADSEPYQKRKARRMLHVLKATVDPKVHRRGIEVLVNELPKKKEFIITLPLTKVQKRLYQTYVAWAADPGRELITGQAKAWSLVAKLGLVLAHPFIFKTVAEAKKAKPLGSKAQPPKSSKAAKAEEEDDDEENAEIPQDVLMQLLATVAVREIEDYALSNKILVLLRILEECRKVGDKVLVFSQSIPTLNYVENIFKRQRVVYQRLDGQTPMSTRQDSVKNFNSNSESEVYLVSTRAGGVGLNIYGANRVIICDFKYTPTEEQQAVGRAYRIGQTKPVYVYWLTIGGTFEDIIHNSAVFKTQLASRVVDKKNPDPWSTRFAEYFAMPREVDQEDLTRAFGQDRVLDALLKSKDLGKLVRKITSTETFEREETYELTPEERQEAEKDIELERLRSQNPEEFRRREHERSLQSRTMSGMPPPGFYQPRSTDGESSAAPHHTVNRSNRMLRIKVPEHLRDKRKPAPPVPTAVSGATSAQLTPLLSRPEDDRPQQQLLTLTSDPALVSPSLPFTHHETNLTAPAPTQAPPLQSNPTVGQPVPMPGQLGANNTPAQAAVPQPIPATGTHFKLINTASPATLLDALSISGSPSNPSAMADEALDSEFPALFAVHSSLCQEGRHVRYHPSDLINKVNGVLARNKVERLPKLDKIQNLRKCSRNPRFAEAMLSGYMEPEQLASLTRTEMESISTSLNGMAEGEFKQRVWTAKADLNVCTGTNRT